MGRNAWIIAYHCTIDFFTENWKRAYCGNGVYIRCKKHLKDFFR